MSSASKKFKKWTNVASKCRLPFTHKDVNLFSLFLPFENWVVNVSDVSSFDISFITKVFAFSFLKLPKKKNDSQRLHLLFGVSWKGAEISKHHIIWHFSYPLEERLKLLHDAFGSNSIINYKLIKNQGWWLGLVLHVDILITYLNSNFLNP